MLEGHGDVEDKLCALAQAEDIAARSRGLRGLLDPGGGGRRVCGPQHGRVHPLGALHPESGRQDDEPPTLALPSAHARRPPRHHPLLREAALHALQEVVVRLHQGRAELAAHPPPQDRARRPHSTW